MKDLDLDLKKPPVGMTDQAFKKKYNMTKAEANSKFSAKKEVEEGAELKQAKRKYNQAAKDANTDQVGAGKKIDTMKKSLRQKDVAKQGVTEMSAGSVATVVNPTPKNKAKVGTLFGGTYKQKTKKA